MKFPNQAVRKQIKSMYVDNGVQNRKQGHDTLFCGYI